MWPAGSSTWSGPAARLERRPIRRERRLSRVRGSGRVPAGALAVSYLMATCTQRSLDRRSSVEVTPAIDSGLSRRRRRAAPRARGARARTLRHAPPRRRPHSYRTASAQRLHAHPHSSRMSRRQSHLATAPLLHTSHHLIITCVRRSCRASCASRSKQCSSA